MNNLGLKCYDLCCGAGIFSFGFKKAGFAILGGNDIDSYAIKTAKRNMPEGNWENLSISKVAENVESDNKHLIHSADVIVAGLPCQGFSVAGKRDPNNEINLLYKDMLRIIRKVKPSFVIIENVKGLLAKRNETIFFSILEGLKKLGYSVDYRLYDSVNFGVPQYRKRIFIIASKNIPVRFIFENVRFEEEQSTVKIGLRGLNARRENKSKNHTFMKHGKKVILKISKIKEGGPISYRRLNSDYPSLTIISGHNALPIHPYENRAISNREAARLQSVPDSFIFEGSRTGQTLQIANAVPYSTANKIASAVKYSNQLRIASEGDLYRRLFSSTNNAKRQLLQKTFINFYEKEGREYPWRRVKDPYKLLITEILLQRTKSDTVRDIWKVVLNVLNSPNVMLRNKTKMLQKVFKKIGLPYRLKTIKRLNTKIVQNFENKVPLKFEELKSLPGVGIYVASAVRVFAFNVPDFPVDANCFRFISRFFGIKLKGKKSEARQIREFMNKIIFNIEARKFVYGFLDFCSAICSAKNPKCSECVLKKSCKSAQISF
jgi:DNA (cytosine-5)-methyltransferase 1